MIVARLLEPSSKLATARALCERTAPCSLVWELGLNKAEAGPDERDLYAAMDWLLARQTRIGESMRGVAGLDWITALRADRLPVHSLRTLLADLGTLTKNQIRLRGTPGEFHQLTEATGLHPGHSAVRGYSGRRDTGHHSVGSSSGLDGPHVGDTFAGQSERRQMAHADR